MIALVRDVCRRAFVPVLLAGLLSACALGESVLEVKPPQPGSMQPAAGAPLVQIDITDARIFQAAPRDPSDPSLEDAARIADPAVRARAIGRKRNAYGMAMGEFVLPPGQTVMTLTRSTTEKVLRDKGYAVVPANTPPPANAIPLGIVINQMWSWLTPGFVEVSFGFKSQVELTSPRLLTQSPATATGNHTVKAMMLDPSALNEKIEAGLSELAEKMAQLIKDAAALRP
jgi:hypothetical protein